MLKNPNLAFLCGPLRLGASAVGRPQDRWHIVETGLTDPLLDDPQHPYTQLLVSSVLAA